MIVTTVNAEWNKERKRIQISKVAMARFGLLLLLLTVSNSIQDNFNKLCPGDVIPENFTIRSVSWLNKDFLLVLHESYFLICEIESEDKVVIIQIQDNYSFDSFDLLKPIMYEAIFYMQFQNDLYLNLIPTIGLITFVGNHNMVYMQPHNPKREYRALAGDNPNGVYFIQTENNSTCIALSNFTNIDFDLTIVIDQIDHCGKRAYERFVSKDDHRMIFHTAKSDQLYEKVPSGYLFQDYLYTFDARDSLVYRIKFHEIKTHMEEDNKDFSVEHQMFAFPDFFICNSSLRKDFPANFLITLFKYRFVIIAVMAPFVIIIPLLWYLVYRKSESKTRQKQKHKKLIPIKLPKQITKSLLEEPKSNSKSYSKSYSKSLSKSTSKSLSNQESSFSTFVIDKSSTSKSEKKDNSTKLLLNKYKYTM